MVDVPASFHATTLLVPAAFAVITNSFGLAVRESRTWGLLIYTRRNRLVVVMNSDLPTIKWSVWPAPLEGETWVEPKLGAEAFASAFVIGTLRNTQALCAVAPLMPGWEKFRAGEDSGVTVDGDGGPDGGVFASWPISRFASNRKNGPATCNHTRQFVFTATIASLEPCSGVLVANNGFDDVALIVRSRLSRASSHSLGRPLTG